MTLGEKEENYEVSLNEMNEAKRTRGASLSAPSAVK